MYKKLLVGLILVCFNSSYAISSELSIEESYAKCHEMEDKDIRLDCFDALKPQNKVAIERAEIEKYYLSTNLPNYMVWAIPQDNDLNDESHAEFFLSLKYPFYFKKQDDNKPKKVDKSFHDYLPDRGYVIYNGLYDFYVTDGLYDSSPVISRLQNLGMAAEWDFNQGKDKLRIGWIHESNGQVLDPDDLAQFEHKRLDKGDDFALSSVSRGWDFLQFRFERSSHLELDDYRQGWWRYHFELRGYFCDCQGLWFFDREDEIWWELGNKATIAEYDGMRFMAEKVFNPFQKQFLVRTEFKTGIRDFSNFSGKLTLGYKLNNTRLTAFYFNGYGKEPSTYHLRAKYVGVGVEFR